MTRILKLTLLAVLVLLGIPIRAQPEKVERETRVPLAEVPAPARAFIEECAFPGKVRWYRETGAGTHTLEAKTRFHKSPLSIEFDASGHVEDVEMEVDFNALSGDIKNALSQTLDATFDTYRILKTQIEWRGSRETLLACIMGATASPEPVMYYELELKGKWGKNRNLYEVLLTRSGELVAMSVILPRNSDHLDY